MAAAGLSWQTMLMVLILPRHPKFATRCAAAAIHRLTLCFPPQVSARLGYSLATFGVTNSLLDPTLELYDSNGNLIVFNDNWQTPQIQAVRAVNLAPSDSHESAFVAAFLGPGSYTMVVRGKNNTTRVALVEAYRLP